LTSILGHSDLARRALSPDSSAFGNIDGIVRGAEQAAELTRQMLAYAGKGRFVVKLLDLETVILDMTRLLKVSISKKCVMRFEFVPDLPAINGDAAQMRQVIMNLIINASEAIGERSGVIAVSTGAMTCDRSYLDETYLDETLAEGLYVYLEVADTGQGMDEETQSKIFDPFFTTKFTGRGLGLAAILGIVRGHKGAIKVYSESDKGTTIKVMFPASAENPAARSVARVDADELNLSGTVLIVDDEETVCGLARLMMEEMGFLVLTGSDGREGLDVFRAHKDDICLVLIDMTMPHMDGAETFRELRRIRDGVPVILSSGYNEQTVTNQFAGKGLAGFIQKPYRYDQLIEVVRKALGK
jgi:CheY-like chemotaxis protein